MSNGFHLIVQETEESKPEHDLPNQALKRSLAIKQLLRLPSRAARISPGNKTGKSGYVSGGNSFSGAVTLFALFQSVTEHHQHGGANVN